MIPDAPAEVVQLKQSMCMPFTEGLCAKGTTCPLAHNLRELAPGGYKPKLCTSFESGNCPRGDVCIFAHTRHELPPNFKTVLCTNFKAGHCRKQQICTFAHGEEEMEFFKKFMSGAKDPPAAKQFALLGGAAPIVPLGEAGLSDSVLAASQKELISGTAQALPSPPKLPAIENQGAFAQVGPPTEEGGLISFQNPLANALGGRPHAPELIAKAVAARQEAAMIIAKTQAGQQPSLPGPVAVNFAKVVAPPRGVVVAPPPRAVRPPLAMAPRPQVGQMLARPPSLQPIVPQQFAKPTALQPPPSLPVYANTQPPSPVIPPPRFAGLLPPVAPGGLPQTTPRGVPPPPNPPGIPDLPLFALGGLPPTFPSGLPPLTPGAVQSFKIKKPCSKFAMGGCLLGDDCPFTHTSSS